jgi:hypothetical protein
MWYAGFQPGGFPASKNTNPHGGSVMFRSVFWVISLVFIFLAHPVFAQDVPGTVVRFSVGPRIYHHEYTEPGIMENQGYFTGVAYNLTYEKSVVVSLDGFLSYGQVDYTSGASGSIDDKDNFCADTRLLLGYAVVNDGRMKLTPYAGIAYRYLSDEGQGRYSTTGNWAYDRESTYIYSPVGVVFSIPLHNGWTFVPSAEYDIFWAGTQKSHLGYQPGYEDFENDQTGGYGLRAVLAFEKQMTRFSLGWELFYRYWDIDRSEIYRDSWGRNWVEPANETTEIGVGVSFRF